MSDAFKAPPHGDVLLSNRTGAPRDMNVREALEKLQVEGPRSIGEPWMTEIELAGYLAPIIERALRAAFYKGWDLQAKLGSPSLKREWVDDGVIAGVAAMREKPND